MLGTQLPTLLMDLSAAWILKVLPPHSATFAAFAFYANVNLTATQHGLLLKAACRTISWALRVSHHTAVATTIRS